MIRFVCVVACICACMPVGLRAEDALADQLQHIAPNANAAAIATASRALTCARSTNTVAQARTLTLIDYSVASTHPRLWVFDLAAKKLLFEELVAHGRNSGANEANHFSNAMGSLMSSIGVFRTSDTYVGHNGYSLRLQGLDPGFNDRALDRDIVIHGASYVDQALARISGRLGRSFGCPAVRPSVAKQLIDTIRDGSLVVAYYPDPDWLNGSKFLHDCG